VVRLVSLLRATEKDMYEQGRLCLICGSEGFAVEPDDGIRCTLCSGRVDGLLVVLDAKGLAELKREHALRLAEEAHKPN